MSEKSTHPSPEELSAYSLGLLSQERAVAIDSHISECEACCETMVGLSSEDTFLGLLKEAKHSATDQTIDQDDFSPNPSWTGIPAPLTNHPRYEVVSMVGKGGMGNVYKAKHRIMERTVALKVIDCELVRHPEAVDRFHREVKTAAQLSHPHIVTAYDAEQAGDVHYLVMEYVDGVDLSQVIKNQGALPVADACEYIRQAAIGLQYAHQQGMVHRDIKPHNLMVTADGTIKILDFGLASLSPDASLAADRFEARSDLTAAGAIMGTPDFISPEQAADARQADIRSDIYSLGTTLYFLLSGRPPFVDGSVMHKLKSHAQIEPEPLQALRDDISADLATIVSRMIAKDPADRFQTPAEVVAALESFSRARQPENSEESPGHQVQSRRQRSRILKLTAVATLFVASIAAIGVFHSPSEEPFMTGGAASLGNDGWRFSYGARYLQRDEPGVLFGMNEDPAGNRKFSYVVLFRHNASNSSSVSFPKKAGGTFDGNVMSITDGITIDGKGVQLALEMRLDKNKSAIESTSLSIDGKPLDYSRGRLLLVDLTSDTATYTQCNAKFPKTLPSPQEMGDDTATVEGLARQLAQLDGVRQFLASAPAGETTGEMETEATFDVEEGVEAERTNGNLP